MEDNGKWYVVHTYSGYENKVKANIEKMVENRSMQDVIFEIMVPMEDTVEIKNGKKKIKYKNFFPGYILLEAYLDDNIKRILARVPSVMGVVGAKNIKGQKLEPVPLKDSEIKRIKAILNDENLTEKIDLKLMVTPILWLQLYKQESLRER